MPPYRDAVELLASSANQDEQSMNSHRDLRRLGVTLICGAIGAGVAALIGWYVFGWYGRLNEQMDPSSNPERTMWLITVQNTIIATVIGSVIGARLAKAFWPMKRSAPRD